MLVCFSFEILSTSISFMLCLLIFVIHIMILLDVIVMGFVRIRILLTINSSIKDFNVSFLDKDIFINFTSNTKSL